MPCRKQQLENGEIYHVVIRRIGDDLLFTNIDDYYRGIFSIYEFNTTDLVTIRERRQIRASIKKNQETYSGPTPVNSVKDSRDKLVDILAFSFMPNHMHLLLRQLKNFGISKFMQKLGTGYSGYFKKKYDLQMRGHFFQDRFVSVHIKTDEQLKIVFVYIHANAISLIEPKWKEIGIKNTEEVIKFLEDYKWSSYLDYIGKQNFPSVINKEFMLEIMGKQQGCKNFVDDWVKHKGKIREFADLALEDLETSSGPTPVDFPVDLSRVVPLLGESGNN
jgi:putative transposase